ncbi:MAG: RsmE family RNA methyltransferase, partial [Treponemataceae bacterium]
MNRILFTQNEIDKPLSRADNRAQHCIKVLQKKEGDDFEAGIINGNAGIATITTIDNENMHFTFKSDEQKNMPLEPLSLIIGFPRPIQLKRILRDCGTFGVQAIHLAGTQLGEKSYLKSNMITSGEAQRALLDGVIQSKGTFLPQLFIHKSLEECLESLALDTLQKAKRIVFDTENPV